MSLNLADKDYIENTLEMYRWVDERIRNLGEEIKEQKESLTWQGVSKSLVCVGGQDGYVESKTEKSALKIDQHIHQLEADLDYFRRQKKKVEETRDHFMEYGKELEWRILSAFYIENKPWYLLEGEFYMCKSQLYKKREAALNYIALLWGLI